MCKALQGEKDLGAVYERIGEKPRRFNAKLIWDNEVMKTIPADVCHYRPIEKEYISEIDIIHGQTFPEDYDFESKSYADIGYMCGMSVPPVMMKRIVQRLIAEGVFSYKGVN